MRPEKVVLFGSYANGNQNDDSDLDFLVVMRTDLKQGKRRGNVKSKLRDLKIPIDIVVFTPEEVDYWRETPSAIVTEALYNGIMLYGK